MPTAFITGISGQDGAYLAHFLLAKGYRVAGGVRNVPDLNGVSSAISSAIEYSNLQALGLDEKIELLSCDLSDLASLRRALEDCTPDEIYNLAAQSSVGEAWENPLETAEVTGLGAVRLFQAANDVCPLARVFQASSSEMFGLVGREKVTENSMLSPLNPYGAAKTYAHHVARNFRESQQRPISCGILFNHESPLRNERFVTRKITQAVARIKCGLQNSLSLGNLEVVRDWGFAGDFVRAMWQMLQTEPADFILATGTPRPLRDFVDAAFGVVGLNSDDYVRVEPQFFRPNDTAPLVADICQSSTRLGWKTEVSFETLVQMMVEADLNRVAGTPKTDSLFRRIIRRAI